MITQKLESAWPIVSERLSAMLRRRGVSPHDADEAIQETAARAMSTGVEFVDADDLLRWASVVSWRIAIDARRRMRVSPVDLPDRPDHVDVAQAAEHRIVLSAVTTRFKELSERDREVLLASFEEPGASSRGESVRLAVARHRARTRLRRLLEGLAAPVLTFVGRRRWRATPEQAALATTTPVLASLAIVLGTMVGPSTPDAPAARVSPPTPVLHASSLPAASAEVAPAAASPRPPVSTPPEQESSPSPVPNPSSGVTAGVHIDEPAGQTTDVSTRPRRPDDHLACVTVPSTSGLVTTCVDPPAPVSR